MNEDNFLYCQKTNTDFEKTVQAVMTIAEREGFRVQTVHDVQKTFPEVNLRNLASEIDQKLIDIVEETSNIN